MCINVSDGGGGPSPPSYPEPMSPEMYRCVRAKLGTFTIAPRNFERFGLLKIAPQIFPDYLRYTTAGVSENEDYQITIGTDHYGRAWGAK